MILGGVLVAVLAFGMGRPIFMQPVRDAERDLENSRRDLEDAQDDEMVLRLARKRLDDAKHASLPPSLNDAQRLYLELVTDLTQECNFAQATVTPGTKQQRTGKFVLVSVEVVAEASLEDFSRFLFQFKQVDLMHRITRMTVNSIGTSGRPRVEVTLTAEGMGVFGGEDISEINPRIPLSEAIDAEATSLTVNSSEEFPTRTPFLVKIDHETLRITDVDENSWTVERAVLGSESSEHSQATMVRHFPVVWERRDRHFRDYDLFLEQSPFTKPPVPRTYDPQLAGLQDITIAPGETATVTAYVEDYNADIGDVSFSLKDAGEGIQIDSAAGQIRWEVPKDQEPAEYKATVLAIQENNPELKLEQTVTVTVKLPNNTPAISVADSFVVLLGQDFEHTIVATDDGDLAQLTWALEGESIPEGLTLDGSTGVLKWNPPLTFSPGEHTVQIKVTDQGDPPQSATKPVKLEVKDDDARFTRLTGTVNQDGRSEAWFKNTRTNSDDTLYVGDELEVANIKVEIVAIEARVVTLKDEQGTWLLALGNTVRDRVLQRDDLAAEKEEAVE